MNTFNDRFFEDVKIVREEVDCAEALERLASGQELSRNTVFWGKSWDIISTRAYNRDNSVDVFSKDGWVSLVMPNIFLVIREVPEDEWTILWEADMQNVPTHHEHSELYKCLRNGIRDEIERELLDGVTLRRDLLIGEREYNALDSFDEDEDSFIPDGFIANNNTEDEALDNVLAEQIMSELSEKDIAILSADHGDGDLLAKKYGMSEEAIRKRKTRLIKRLQSKYDIGDV